VLAWLLYASPAWWGFATVQDWQKICGFLLQSTRIGFYSPDLPNFEDLCLQADQNMFSKVLRNPHHVLHRLLPPVSTICHSYSLRPHVRDRVLSDCLSHLTDCNFIIRVLFYQAY